MCQCRGHGPGRHHGHGGHGGCGCGDRGHSGNASKEAQLGKLEKYLSDLKKEVRAVEELIKELKEEA